MENKVAEVQLKYKRHVPHSGERITSSSKAADIFRSDWEDIDYIETFKVLYLDIRNNVLAMHQISSGGTNGVIVDAKIIFQGALLIHASHIILAHNHPSGDTAPSNVDIQLTNKLVTAAKYLDMKVLDHIIISSEGYTSLSDTGRI